MNFMQMLPVLFSQVIALVSNPPGSLVYHLVLLFAFQAAAAIAFGQWRKGGAEARLFWAAAGLFVVRLVLLVVALLEFAALVSPQVAVPPVMTLLKGIPPLDRAGSTLTILLIIWAFAFPKPSRLADAVMGALALFTFVALGISWVLWTQDLAAKGAALTYNGSMQESVWEAVQLVLLGLGVILLVIRRKEAWYIGVPLTLLLIVPHGLQLYPSFSGNVPGIVRLFEIVALPMFITALVYRSSHAPISAAQAPAAVPLPLPASTALAPSAVNGRALVALASLNAAADLEQRRQSITLALAYLFQADLSLFILPPDKTGAAPVACCYRVSRGQFSSRPDIPLKEFPAVAAVLQGSQAARLTFDEHDVELRRLAAGTGLDGVGFGLLAPLTRSADFPLGVVALLASGARPAWTVEDQNLLGTLAQALAGVFDTADQLAALRHESQAQRLRADAADGQRRVIQETAEKLMDELAQAQNMVMHLTSQVNQAQSAAQSHAPDRAALSREAETADEQKRHDEERNRLEVELEAAQEGLAALALLQSQFKLLSDETEGLRQAKAELEKEAEGLRNDLQSAEAQVQAFAMSDQALESEAQSQQTTQLRLELELARMELQGVAERRATLVEQAEKDKQQLSETAQADIGAIQSELDETKAKLQQLADWREQREPELTGELDRTRTELQAALERQAELAKVDDGVQALIQEVQTTLAEKETSLQQRAVEQAQREADTAAQLVSLRAELEQTRAELQQAVARADALAQAEQGHQTGLAEAAAAEAVRLALAEKETSLQQQTEAHAEELRQREAALTEQLAVRAAEVEQTRAELQQALARADALAQAEQGHQAGLAEALAAAEAVRLALAEKETSLQQQTEAHAEELRQREAALTEQLAGQTAELEQTRAELQQAVARADVLAQAEQEHQAGLAEALAAAEAVRLAFAEKETSLQQSEAHAEELRQREAALTEQLAGQTAELERTAAELQQAVARADALAQAEQQGQALLAEAQAALAEKTQGLQQLAEQHAEDLRQRESEQMTQAAERSVEWECLRADLLEAQTTLSEKTLTWQQAVEQQQYHNDELTGQVERLSAELQQAGERAAALEVQVTSLSAHIAALEETKRQQESLLQNTQATLAAAESALAEETLNNEQLAEQHAEALRQREAEIAAQTAERTAELERVQAERQQIFEQSTAQAAQIATQTAALEQAEQQHQALTQTAQTESAGYQDQLRQLTDEAQQREAEWRSTLEQTQAELGRVLEQRAALEKAGQERQAQLQEVQTALGTARAAIAGQAAAFVSTQDKLAEKERELSEALAKVQAAAGRPEMSPAAETTLEQVAALTQDLRQPIMSISGYVSLLLGESAGLVGAVQKKFLERIQAACERLEVLLNDLSQASEAAFGTKPLAMSSVKVTQLVEEALQANEALLREKGIHLRLELAENLPALQADAMALRRVFSGLIHNAASATSLNGEVRLVVRRETQTAKDDPSTECIFISVKDSGSGLSPEDLPKVFSSTSRLEVPLAGLGDAGRDLVALRPLVEAHHGRIWVTSELGQGSLFSVLLPVTDIPKRLLPLDPPEEPDEPPLPMAKALDFLVLPPD
jgi:signal transduction histidine kinase